MNFNETNFNEGGADLDFRVESNGNANRFFIDGGSNSGEGAVIVGHNASLGLHRVFQITGNSPDTSGMEMFKYTNDTSGPTISMTKSRGGSIGSSASVNDGDTVGQINWFADDGTDTANIVATIHAEIDGTPGSNDTPGALVFATTADGANSQTERMRIDDSGNVGIGTASPGSYNSNARNLVIRDSGNMGITLSSGASSDCFIGFSNGEDTGLHGLIQYDHANNKMHFRTNDVDSRLTINSSGNVGINVASPVEPLHIVDSASSGVTPRAGTIAFFEDDAAARITLGSANDNDCVIHFGDDGDNDIGGITYAHGDNSLQFRVNASERARIDSTGNLLIAATSFNGIDDSSVKGIALRATAGRAIHTLDSGANAFEFNTHNNGNAGEITCTGTSTTYSTSSDYRLKDVKNSIQNGLERTLALNPVEFEWKADGRMSEGFIAHEAQEIFPDAVNGKKDGEKMQSMDYGRITPLLVKAIQEQQEQIEELKQQINELRGN
jgi:hypothetical protein